MAIMSHLVSIGYILDNRSMADSNVHAKISLESISISKSLVIILSTSNINIRRVRKCGKIYTFLLVFTNLEF